ncbi:protein cereblon [Senna tora]|uniref:Protein cereblon n=1 Tax=Senna tora TaxID=362788 RepID=A0A834WBD8_9FABA|nr:protein cereblon [Senna tora]
MDDDRILERERRQIEQIRQLDLEELQVEEVDDLQDSSDEDANGRGYYGVASSADFTFDTCITSLHTYLGEVEDTHHRTAFLDGGAVLNLPLFYLEGVVLFPGATLPLRVIQPNFVAAVERSLSQVDVPYTIGVIRVHRDNENRRTKLASIGTTAEIRQYRRLEDGSLNVVTRGQQRFRLKRCWFDVEGVPLGEIQIIEEELPLRTPKDAFGKLAPLSNLPHNHANSHLRSNYSCTEGSKNGDNDSEESFESFEDELSLMERRIHQSVIGSSHEHDIMYESSSSDYEDCMYESDPEIRCNLNDSDSARSLLSDFGKQAIKMNLLSGSCSTPGKQSCKREECKSAGAKFSRGISRTFWPQWVYRMFDSYCLAQRAADLWKNVVGLPSMDGLLKKPDLLSFYIASKIPVSESTRQELLEIDSISYRLRREIELLESVNLVRCKNCQTIIARRSDMLVMSSEGPLGAYVNPGGYVHEIMTLYKASGLALIGRAETEYSWFPGTSNMQAPFLGVVLREANGVICYFRQETEYEEFKECLVLQSLLHSDEEWAIHAALCIADKILRSRQMRREARPVQQTEKKNLKFNPLPKFSSVTCAAKASAVANHLLASAGCQEHLITHTNRSRFMAMKLRLFEVLK